MTKRLFDVFIALIGLILTFPLFLFIGLLIKIEDGGCVFFAQERIGRFGKKFHIYKFRSMSVLNIEVKVHFDPGNRSRVTRVGSFIRKTKLDELPQLINVLKGEMSIVGPRPEVEEWVNIYPQKWKIIHKVKPGITDNASIKFRNEEYELAKSNLPYETYMTEILPKKLDIYEDYVKTRSFIGDILIILKTIFIIKK